MLPPEDKGRLIRDKQHRDQIITSIRNRLNTAPIKRGSSLFTYGYGRELPVLKEYLGEIANPNVNVMDAFINKVRAGEIDLAPKKGDGWYHHSQFALETLICFWKSRESTKLDISPEYEERLEDAFRTAYAKERETFAKFLEPTLGVSIYGEKPEQVIIRPEFSIEPMAEVYLRTARSYRFLHTSLIALHGEQSLTKIQFLTQEQKRSEQDVQHALNYISSLMYGAYGLSCSQMGLQHNLNKEEISNKELQQCMNITKTWLTALTDDPDLQQDTRVSVPIMAMGVTRFWGTIGVNLKRVTIEYLSKPSIKGPVEPVFETAEYYCPDEVFCEFILPGETALSRREFQNMCDSGKGDIQNIKEILNAVKEEDKKSSILWWLLLFMIVLPLTGFWGVYRFRKNGTFFIPVMLRDSVLGLLMLEVLLALILLILPVLQAKVAMKWIIPRNWATILMADKFLWHVPRKTARKVILQGLSDDDPDIRFACAHLINAAYWKVEMLEACYFDKHDLTNETYINQFINIFEREQHPAVVSEMAHLFYFYRNDRIIDIFDKKLQQFPRSAWVKSSVLSWYSNMGSDKALLRLMDFIKYRSHVYDYPKKILRRYFRDKIYRETPPEELLEVIEFLRKNKPKKWDIFQNWLELKIKTAVLKDPPDLSTFNRGIIYDYIHTDWMVQFLEKAINIPEDPEIRRQIAQDLFNYSGKQYHYIKRNGDRVLFKPGQTKPQRRSIR